MGPCLIAIRFVPDDHRGSVTPPGNSALSNARVGDDEISDRDELAELKRDVGLLVGLGLCPLLIVLAGYWLKPEFLRIDITPVTIERCADEP